MLGGVISMILDAVVILRLLMVVLTIGVGLGVWLCLVSLFL